MAENPRVWLILEDRAGDDAQLVNLADNLGWPYEIKKPLYTIPEVLQHRVCGYKPRTQGPPEGLDPPWPDLLLTIGGRSIVAAKHVREMSGGQTRIVCLGRPWGPLDWFDLIVTTPQYRLPRRHNILQNSLPLNYPPTLRNDPQEGRWRDRLANLPRPYHALIVGGSNGTYVFNEHAAIDLARRVDEEIARVGGSVLIATSPRTDAGPAQTLFDQVRSPNVSYQWTSETRHENPYALFLNTADRIVVTGDSASMIAEACATDAEVFLYNLPESNRTKLMDRVFSKTPAPEPEWIAKLIECGLWVPRRDLNLIHHRLLASGRVAYLGGTPQPKADIADLDLTIQRIEQLLDVPTQPERDRLARYA